MKIQAAIEIFNSRSDFYGNRYWAFRYTDIKTGRDLATQGIGEDHPHFESHVSDYWTEYAVVEAA